MHGYQVRAILMHSGTSLSAATFKPNSAIIKDCSKKRESLQYDERSYELLRFECMV